MQRVAIVPVFWEGAKLKASTLIEKSFYKSVLNSKRFKVINNELTKKLWDTKKGRAELIKQFEMDSLISLTITTKSDVIYMTARLYDTNLKIILRESNNILLSNFNTFSKSKVRNYVQKLIYSLINLLPLDSFVTSVQGEYITLSSGEEIGIKKGETFDIERVIVTKTHPILSTWQNYARQHLGSATIFDVKKHSAVAKLDYLNYPNAVEVDDGVLVKNAPSRIYFKSILQEDIKPKIVVKNKKRFIDNKNTITLKNPSKMNPKFKENKQKIIEKSKTPNVAINDEKNKEKSVWPKLMWPDINLKKTSMSIIEDINAELGTYLWSASGPKSATSEFPLWIFNKFSIDIHKRIYYKFHLNYGGGAIFGKTSNGQYFGYDSNIRLYYRGYFENSSAENKTITPEQNLLSFWFTGVNGRFNGTSVEDEEYGGGDWIKGGFFAGIGGKYTFDADNLFDWSLELGITPLAVGKLGYLGKNHFVESSIGYHLKIKAIESDPNKILKFGAQWQLIDDKHTFLENKVARRMHITENSFQFLVRYSLQ